MGWTAILSEEEHKLMSLKRHLSGSCFFSFLYVNFGVANGESEVLGRPLGGKSEPLSFIIVP